MKRLMNTLIAVVVLSALPWMPAAAAELPQMASGQTQVALLDLSAGTSLRGGDYGV